jgi:hypothetical protein
MTAKYAGLEIPFEPISEENFDRLNAILDHSSTIGPDSFLIRTLKASNIQERSHIPFFGFDEEELRAHMREQILLHAWLKESKLRDSLKKLIGKFESRVLVHIVVRQKGIQIIQETSSQIIWQIMKIQSHESRIRSYDSSFVPNRIKWNDKRKGVIIW